MSHRRRQISYALLAVALAGFLMAGPGRSAAAQSSPIRVISSGAESQFPTGIRFFAEVESSAEIDEVRVTFTVGDRRSTQYNYLDIPRNAGTTATGELLHRTDTPERYIPPGSRITYFFEITDDDGNTLRTDPQELIFTDARFEWDTVTVGAVTVYYHGPVSTRAQRLAEASNESLEIMGPVTGAETETPIILTLYNNNSEMIGAVVPRSTTITRELITEGQAFAEENVVLVLAGRSDIGTATHEITHILVGRAANGTALVPLWLNEGLAEYGNLDKTTSYDRYLEWATDTGRLTPLSRLNRFPGDPNLVIVSYGQARSVVEYMIETYGPEKMAALLAAIQEGQGVNAAMETAYAMSLQQLEDEWRDEIGAEPYVEPTPRPTVPAGPTAQPTPALRPYSLTPYPTATQDPATLSTATTEAGVTPGSETPATTPAADATSAPEPPASSATGGCNAFGNDGHVEAGGLAGLVALAALAAVRAVRRR